MEHRILLVTSQEQLLVPIAAVLKSILGYPSFTVQPAAAIAEASNQRYNLIILDVHNQRRHLELVRSIKQALPTMPLIAMVPYGDVIAVQQVIEHGADDYISQPIALERLKVSLRNALRMRLLLQRVSKGESASEMFPVEQLEASSPFMTVDGSLKPLQAIEEQAIEFAIKQCNGCITQAARALGVGRSTLYRKIQESRGAQSSGKLQAVLANQTTRPTIFDSSIKVS